MYELGERVEDWKGHNLHSFGELLLNGHYQVIKGDSSNPREQEREVRVRIISCLIFEHQILTSTTVQNVSF
jgi:cell division control protein 24